MNSLILTFLSGCIQEDVLGTKLYLEMVNRYAVIFLSNADCETVVRNCGYIVSFLVLWRAFIHQKPGQTLQKQFISRQTYDDTLLSCHFVVFLIMWYRDHAPSLNVCLSITGTDVCESFFSENGSFVLNKHTYTFNDMIRNTGKMNHINSISSRGLVKLKKAHMKQEIVWSSDGRGFNGSEVPEDDILCRYWESGAAEAKSVWGELGLHDFSSVVQTTLNFEYDDTTGSPEHSDVPQAVADDVEIELLMRQAMDEELTENINSSPSHSLTIDVPGSGKVYKSTLVTLLNTGDNLSKDRLKRVQAPTFIGSSNADSVNLSHTDEIPDDEIHLFSDILFMYRRQYQLGRFQRLYTVNGGHRTEYVRPVTLSDDSNVKAHVRVYQSLSDDLYSYTDQTVDISLSAISGLISICLGDNSTYHLSPASKERLDSLVAANVQTPAASSTTTAQSVSQPDDFTSSDRVVTTVQPAPGSRSRRVRRVVTILD